ncbi:MAG: hypothetical protein LKF99_06160 [Bifidobacterium sp.]|jgi:hypothetical protein|nr:hypothetical protein [Bifidobacterium sp.]
MEPTHDDGSTTVERRWTQTEAIILWAAWTLTLAFNVFAQIGKLGGVSTADISNEVSSWFTPAGYAFAIWGAIYLALALWLVALCGDKSRTRLGPLPLTTRGALFALTCALNIVWLISWHYRQFAASIIVIALLLVAVWALYTVSRQGLQRRRGLSFLSLVPLSLYGSWLAVATLANIMHVISRYHDPNGNNTIAQATSTVALLLLLVAVSAFMNARLHDWMFGLVVIWSAVAIAVRLMDVSKAFAVMMIVLTTLGTIVIYTPWTRLLSQR